MNLPLNMVSKHVLSHLCPPDYYWFTFLTMRIYYNKFNIYISRFKYIYQDLNLYIKI